MAEYVSKEILLDFVKQNTPHINGETTMECVERTISEAPTADVVEVVRCKDCERVYKYKDRYFCLNDNSEMNADDFCSYGEREER